MSIVVWVVVAVAVLCMIGLLAGILYTQKQLDTPCSGLLLVDHQEEGPAPQQDESPAGQ